MTALPSPKMLKRSRKVSALLKRLHYETVGGETIYRKGFRAVLSGEKPIEEIMGDSTLQGWLKLNLGAILLFQLEGTNYDLTGGEQGLLLGRKDRRDADIAIFKKENLVLNKFYSKLPPEVVIEIDVEADTEDTSEMAYVYRKVADYFAFGVKKTIWVFSENKNIVVFSPDEKPEVFSWKDTVEVIAGAKFNIAQMLKKRGIDVDQL